MLKCVGRSASEYFRKRIDDSRGRNKNTRSYLRNHRAPRIHKNRSEEGMKLLLVNEENGKLKRETIQFSDKRAKAFFVQKIYKIRERRLKRI